MLSSPMNPASNSACLRQVSTATYSVSGPYIVTAELAVVVAAVNRRKNIIQLVHHKSQLTGEELQLRKVVCVFINKYCAFVAPSGG